VGARLPDDVRSPTVIAPAVDESFDR